ncbi:hypothetical protein ANN_10467 [Periplaneta americana]|uniref:Uncharacterized protein n=1 Tax=Periplaneta americana TaxID=6978 RepID=A0ABQ8TP25_PERAM|nr:hypothetical protein ANN_10467 [Periplaneta americana]
MAGLYEGCNEPSDCLKASNTNTKLPVPHFLSCFFAGREAEWAPYRPGSARSSQDRERAYRPAYGFHSGQYSCTLKSISGGTYRDRLGTKLIGIFYQKYLCAKNMNLSNVMDVVVRTINFIRSKGLNHMEFRALLDDINSEYGDLLFHTEWLQWVRDPGNISEVTEGFMNSEQSVTQLVCKILIGC